MMSTSARRIRAATLVEVMIACAIFLVIGGLTHLFISRSMEGLQRVSDRSMVRRELARLTNMLRRDVESMSYSDLKVAPAASSLAGFDGDAIWGLSARDLDGKFHLLADGSAFWQNQVLYYPTIRTDYQTGSYQGSGLTLNNYEVSYPFKQVVRRVIDKPGLTDTTDPSTMEPLSLDLSNFFSRPTGVSLTSFPDALKTQVISSNILEFRAVLQTDNSIEFKISGYTPESKPKRLGAQDLTSSPQTRTVTLRLYPKQSLTL